MKSVVATSLIAAACLLLSGIPPSSAQVPMNGDPGGAKKMNQAMVIESKKEDIKFNREEGMMDRAMHRMQVAEKKALNEALVERGSLTLADGTVIESNKNAGEQVIDPRTPKGFGNPFFRQIHVEQNIKVNDLLNEFEQKKLAQLKWQDGEDVKANATEEVAVGTGWTPFIAEGEMKTPAVRAPEFMAMLEVSPNRIIRRVCQSCDEGFKDVYYKRLTDAYTRNLRNMFRDRFDELSWGGCNNECWVDFTLHSTYEDAIAGTNPWPYCLPAKGHKDGHSVGFPSFSSPFGTHGDGYNRGGSAEPDYAFYVETGNWLPTAATYRLDIKGSRDGRDIEGTEIAKIDQYINESPHRIARRVCNDCTGVFKDVYYKHVAPDLMSVAGVDYFLMENFQPFGREGFEFNQDFKIYSTYEDAIADTNAWEYCEWLPAGRYGFPGNCRPKLGDAATPNQWSRVSVSGGSLKAGRRHTCLYIEKAEAPPDREEWMSIDEEMELFFYGDRNADLPACLAKGEATPNTLGGTMTPLSTTTVEQVYHSQQWFSNPRDTYAESRQFCQSKGMDLCPSSVVCPNGAGQAPFGGTKGGDEWVPVLDEDNDWYQAGTWHDGQSSNTCRSHEDLAGIKPSWGLYGGSSVKNFVPCCAVDDEFAFDFYAGWYDVRGCGECHDYCFWMHHSAAGKTYEPKFSPGSNPWYAPIAFESGGIESGELDGYFTCVPSGSGAGASSTGPHDGALVNGDGVSTFKYRKCGGEGFPAPPYRREEYVGCYRTGDPSALPELIGSGQRIGYSRCADACRSRNYHYFGRTADEQCWCGGRTLDDESYGRFGLVPYRSNDYCACEGSSNIGPNMCTYRLVDQFDPTTARKQHSCTYLPAYDMRKMCYIACRDADMNLTNKLTCNMLMTVGKQYLAKMISKSNDDGGEQLHMLGGDLTQASGMF